MGWINSLLISAILVSQTAELPPPFPRPGTTSLLVNDAVAVWNVSWLKQKYPLHHHSYDLVGISYTDGDRVITQGTAEGRLTHTAAWEFQTNRAGVNHVEEGASEPPLRAILIEVKAAAPRPAGAAISDGLRQVAGAPTWENNRAAAWFIGGGSSAPMHRHVGDAVEIVFDAGTPVPSPRATFVAAGTVHAGPSPAASGRAYIFEIK
jgi:hypothetical protein